MGVSKPYSIKIFVPAGNPDGVRTIEKSNWSGAGIVVPRPLMNEARQRKDLTRTGVYVLLGPPEESGLPRVYVGEGDPIRQRLDSHANKKDFWTVCIAFTSKDENLNKAHVQYIESKLVEMATKAKRCVLDNGNVPALPSMSESDAADAEGFLSEMMLCFPVLGVHVFTAGDSSKKVERQLTISSKSISATGWETDNGFLVRKGSGAALTEVPSCHGYLKELRAALIENGVLKREERGFVFTQDYVFSSPSTAAGVVQGRSSNGRVDWKTKEGKTLKDIQESGVKA